jgi:hypothetical protein
MSRYFTGARLRTVIKLKKIGDEIFEEIRVVTFTDYDFNKFLFNLDMKGIKYTHIDDVVIIKPEK